MMDIYQEESYEDIVEWNKLVRRCEDCKDKFKCFTTNTSNRPHQLVGINFQVAKCCLRCKHGKFKTGKDPEYKTKLIRVSQYLRVGACLKHKVSVHQFSCCDDFEKKLQDSLSWEVHNQIQKELAHLTHNYKFPRYCIIGKKHIGKELKQRWYGTIDKYWENE